jgi:hypothetical protein
MQRLEVAVRRLHVLYSQFFAGALDRQPYEAKKEVDRIVDRVNRSTERRNYAERFHFTSIVSRYQSQMELWNKTIRNKEMGDRRSASQAERMGIRERLLTRCVVGAEGQDPKELARLHSRYSDARRREGKAPVAIEKFAQNLKTQTDRLRQKHECGQIEIRVVENDEGVQIRARPSRG